MSNNTSSRVSKVWSFCNPLRDVGVGNGDYLEQFMYLLFLKMADECRKPPLNRKLNIPKE
jgi:type I restriction enzyme M protein